jgi:hypothetical protein
MKSTKTLKIFHQLQARPPAVGSTVHYGVNGRARAAIISEVDPFSLSGKVHLTVFLPGKPTFSTDAYYSARLKNGFWTWPSSL